MDMKLHPLSSQGLRNPTSTTSRDISNTRRGNVHQSADALHLTSQVSILKRAELSLAAMPTIDSAHISAVSSAIQNGNYQVDAEQVAEKIIHFEQALP